MKILFFIGALTSGGKERRLLELLTYLSQKQEYQLLLVTKKTEVLFPNFYDLNIQWISLSSENLSWGSMKEFYQIVKQEQPNIIHAWGDKFALLANLCKVLNPSIRVVDSEITSAPPSISLKNKLLCKFNFSLADVVLANSDAGLKIFNPPRSISKVIYNGLNMNRFNELSDPVEVKQKYGLNQPFTVLMVASYSANKDYKKFFSVGKELRALRNDVLFFGVGFYDETEPYYQEVLNYIEDNPGLIAYPGSKEVESIVNVADIGVLFSPNGEGLSNSILEYMALGKPVIANDAGGTKEIVHHNQNGILIKNESPREIAYMIHDLLNDPDRMRRMGEQSKQRILDDFSLDRMGVEFEAVYKKLMNP
ncbi:MAG: glycosyltransferase family 4 protein [Mongoliitalea sp.]